MTLTRIFFLGLPLLALTWTVPVVVCLLLLGATLNTLSHDWFHTSVYRHNSAHCVLLHIGMGNILNFSQNLFTLPLHASTFPPLSLAVSQGGVLEPSPALFGRRRCSHPFFFCYFSLNRDTLTSLIRWDKRHSPSSVSLVLLRNPSPLSW